jgi:hypothetical protein
MENNNNQKNFTFSLTYNIKTNSFETKLYHQEMQYVDLIRAIAAMKIKAGDIANMMVDKLLNDKQKADPKEVDLAFAAISKDIMDYMQYILSGENTNVQRDKS